MAKETLSERLVRMACSGYLSSGRARIKKNDPYIRLIGGKERKRLIYSGSSGLDFSGVLKGGRHITFEVKETESMALPVDNIGTSQIDMMEREHGFGAEAFLLVLFKQNNQWYRLEYDGLKKVITDNDCRYASIPLEYFRAFGRLVPNDDGTPDFLSPERHPAQASLEKTYPEWMSGHERRERTTPLTEKPYANNDERRARILGAIVAGIKNAEKRERMVELYKKGHNNGLEGRDSSED